jgi:lipoyl synthase
MGDSCTRGCRFCSVGSLAKPPLPDPLEPAKLAETLAEMALEYVVITTVCRDDLPDQGASHLVACVKAVKDRCPEMKLELLAQDFRGKLELVELVDVVLDSGIDVFAHNLETVERLTPSVRDAKAGYRQSLDVLAHARGRMPTKSSLMLGLGETEEELMTALRDLRGAGVDIVTLGQYLRPDSAGRNLPVAEYVTPERFEAYGERARELGFLYVASGPFVRSSYRAGELFIKGMLS